MPYRELFAQLAPVVDRVEGALWMRQMVLGPAREFCLHTTAPVSMLGDLDALVISASGRHGQTWRTKARSRRAEARLMPSVTLPSTTLFLMNTLDTARLRL
jgi:hypothetical protein